MKSGKVHQEEEDYEDDEFGSKRDATISSNNNTRDGKNSEKVNAMRSKHSVTEQRRRSKINERFQVLRDLIPHSEQKRDTASFLLEVIQYVQFLQEKVQKYEGSCPPWTSEPTKLMPWRNSHWRAQNCASQPQSMKNGSGPGSTYPCRYDERSVAALQMGQPNSMESVMRDTSIDHQNELPNKVMGLPMPVSISNEGLFSHTLTGQASDAQSAECPCSVDALNHQDEFAVEGGTISISSAYSEGLLNSLSQALQSTGVDLSQANISVQINLGKRTNAGSTLGLPTAKEHGIPMRLDNQSAGTFVDSGNNEDLGEPNKRLKI